MRLGYAVNLVDGDLIRFQKIINDTMALQKSGSNMHLSDWTAQSYATYEDLTGAGRSVDFNLFGSDEWSKAVAQTVKGHYQPLIKFLSEAIDTHGEALVSQLQCIQDPKAKELVAKAENRSAYEVLRHPAYKQGALYAQALNWAYRNNLVCSTAAKLGADPKISPGIVLEEITEQYRGYKISQLNMKYQDYIKNCGQRS
jgi:hypothetical protein